MYPKTRIIDGIKNAPIIITLFNKVESIVMPLTNQIEVSENVKQNIISVSSFLFLRKYLKMNSSIIGYSKTALKKNNQIVRNCKPSKTQKDTFLSSVNSYLGIMKHYQTYKIRKKILKKYLSGYWLNHFYISSGYQKLVKKKRIMK